MTNPDSPQLAKRAHFVYPKTAGADIQLWSRYYNIIDTGWWLKQHGVRRVYFTPIYNTRTWPSVSPISPPLSLFDITIFYLQPLITLGVSSSNRGHASCACCCSNVQPGGFCSAPSRTVSVALACGAPVGQRTEDHGDSYPPNTGRGR